LRVPKFYYDDFAPTELNSGVENQIYQWVYDLYGMTEEEIKIVEA